jgi:uncharacterized protein (DUF58 family)
VGKYLFFLLAALFAVAVLLREEFVFTLIYLLAGTFCLARWWGQRSFQSITIQRHIPARLFLGEKTRCRVEIHNRGWLPVAWLQIHESLPPELAGPKTYHAVVPLRPKGEFKFEYWLDARRRGYYPIGPLTLYSGDIFGVVDQSRRSYTPDYLTVFPRIIPLTHVPLPSRSPLGTLRHTQPAYEDPSRVIGKRDYTSGDSLRRIDWKSSAASGRLQVKNYEPSIELQTQIILNLNAGEYDARRRFDDSELAIVVAASLANWISGKRQSVGLATNGSDPLEEHGRSPFRPSRSGRGHLLRILEVLARIESKETYPLVELLWQQRLHLAWGTTQVLISPYMDDELLDELFQGQRTGFGTVIITIGTLPGYRTIEQKARYFGFPLYNIQDESDLDIWRRGKVIARNG